MPKLNKQQAKQVSNAEKWEGGGYLLPEGRYAARLVSVTERPGTEAPYWEWKYDQIHDADGNKRPGQQWENTGLSDKAAGKLKQVFEAFGYTPDSDTDEMIGEWAVLYLVQAEQQKGKNAGKIRNEVASTHPFEPGDWPFDPEGVPPVGATDAGGDAPDDF